MATRLERLYEDDFHVWTREQTKALRRLAETRPNVGIDFRHLVEEVRVLGKGECSAVRSQIARVLDHLPKLEHSPAPEPREDWYDTIGDARRELHSKLSPSLRYDAARRLLKLYALARCRGLEALVRMSS